MKKKSTGARKLLLGLGLAVAAFAAQAGTQIYWSVNIGSPGFQSGYGYPGSVYYPAPTYVAPPVIYAPVGSVYGPPAYILSPPAMNSGRRHYKQPHHGRLNRGQMHRGNAYGAAGRSVHRSPNTWRR